MASDLRAPHEPAARTRRVPPPSVAQRDVDLSSVIGRQGRPEQLDSRSVLAVQRRAGNKATVQLLRGAAVQRDLGKVEKPKMTLGRPKSIKAVDTAVAALVEKLAKQPGSADVHKTLITAVHKAIADFRASKDGSGKWAAAVTKLEGEVKVKEGDVDARIAVKAKGRARYDIFTTLEPELAKYAARSMYTPSDFEADATGPSIKSALSGPRGAGGELSDATMTEMTATQAGEIAKESAGGQQITFGGLSVAELRDFMATHTNVLTGNTMYPELKNITDPNRAQDAVVTTQMDVGGVSMMVEHNPSDVNLAERLKLVEDAVKKVTAAGLKVPPLKLHLPKYGRSLKLKATDGAPGQIGCETADKSSRAVYIPPDFMHLSSEVIGTPDLTKVKNPVTGAEEYKFSSTGFDPSGVATLVHEIGHALHFATAPAKYHALWGTSFTGTTSSGKQSSEVATTQVSQYGNKPREFVAEVFLGLVYGKEYSADVMEMYRSFGGVFPPAVTAKAAAKAL